MIATPPPPSETFGIEDAIWDVTLSFLVTLVGLAVLVGVVAFFLIRAGRLPHPISLVVALGVLGALAIAASATAQRPHRAAHPGRYRGRWTRCGGRSHLPARPDPAANGKPNEPEQENDDGSQPAP